MSIGGSFGKLVLFGAVGGVLVALAAYPGIFTIGRSADTASDSYLALPASLETPPTYQTSYVYANDNKTLITSFYEENRRDVTLSQVSEAMQQTVVAAEDVRFFQHGGVDYKAIIRALVADQQSGQTTQGASTLTMQYVRNVLKTDPSLTPEERAAAVEDSIGRKIQEARYAIDAGTEAHQAADSRALHEHRLFRPGRLRRLRGGSDLLLHDAGQADSRAGLAAVRHHPVAGHLQPGQRRRGRGPDPAEICADRDGRDEGDHPGPGRRGGQGAARAEAQAPAERLHRSAVQDQFLGLLLRLLPEVVGRSGGLRRDLGGPGGQPASGRLPHRHDA